MAAQQHEVTARLWDGVLVERYWFSPNFEVSLPKHTHDDYQVGLALTDSGEYHYRRAFHHVPVGSISVIHPGEVHSGCGFNKRVNPTEFLSFYIPPQSLTERIYADEVQKHGRFPFVRPILLDPSLEAILRRLHAAFCSSSVTLEDEVLWNAALRRLFPNNQVEANRLPSPTKGVRLVREYIDQHAAERLSRRQLARIADLTEWHLSRSFHRAFGISLHRYQIQKRVDLGKRLLVLGMPASEVALLAGFANQSHMGRHFRELLKVGPVAYQGTAKP